MGVAGSSAGGAIRAGLAFVELAARDNSLIRALDNAQKRLQSFGSIVSRVGAATAAAGAGILAPVAALFSAAVSRSADLAILAEEFGTTTETLSALGYAFETTGIKQEEFADTLKGLSQKLAAAADGQDELFQRMGLNARELINLPIDEQFNRIADALARVPLAADRTNLSLQLFGGAGSKLNRVLGRGSAELNRLKGEAEDAGAVLGGDTAAAGLRLNQVYTRLSSTLRYAFLAIGEALFPQVETIEEFARAAGAVIKTIREWIKENKGLVLGAVAVGGAIFGIGSAATAAGFAATGLAAIIGGVTTAFSIAVGTITTVIGALVTPLGAAAAAVGILGTLFATHTETGRELADVVSGELSSAWGTLRDTAVSAWGGIASALKRGDLQSAGEIALAGLTVAFQQGLLTLRTAWMGLQGYFVDGWSKSASAVSGIWTDLIDRIAVLFTKLIGSILTKAAGLAGAVGATSLEDSLKKYQSAAVAAGKTIDADRKRADADRKKALDEELADREIARELDLNASREALDLAKERFQDLLKTEAERAASVKATETSAKVAAAAQGAQSALASAARGTFSAAVSRQVFNVGNTVALRSLTAQQQTRDAVIEVRDAVRAKEGGVFE